MQVQSSERPSEGSSPQYICMSPEQMMPSGQPCPALMTADEVAEYLRWGMENRETALRKLKLLRDSGDLVGVPNGNGWLYRHGDVAKYVEGL